MLCNRYAGRVRKRSSIGYPPLAERLAVSPSFVAGTYAPPVNLRPHLAHTHMPTLSRRTDLELHCGQMCFCLISEMTPVYRLLAATPYRTPNPPVGPIFFVLFRRPISPSQPASLSHQLSAWLFLPPRRSVAESGFRFRPSVSHRRFRLCQRSWSAGHP